MPVRSTLPQANPEFQNVPIDSYLRYSGIGVAWCARDAYSSSKSRKAFISQNKEVDSK